MLGQSELQVSDAADADADWISKSASAHPPKYKAVLFDLRVFLLLCFCLVIFNLRVFNWLLLPLAILYPVFNCKLNQYFV